MYNTGSGWQLTNSMPPIVIVEVLPASKHYVDICRQNGKTLKRHIIQLPSEQEPLKYTANFWVVRNRATTGWPGTPVTVTKKYHSKLWFANDRVFSSAFVMPSSEYTTANSPFDTSETSKNGATIIVNMKKKGLHCLEQDRITLQIRQTDSSFSNFFLDWWIILDLGLLVIIMSVLRT